jgi:hypothetical protein
MPTQRTVDDGRRTPQGSFGARRKPGKKPDSTLVKLPDPDPEPAPEAESNHQLDVLA